MCNQLLFGGVWEGGGGGGLLFGFVCHSLGSFELVTEDSVQPTAKLVNPIMKCHVTG